jgi:hypothetical protein
MGFDLKAMLGGAALGYILGRAPASPWTVPVTGWTRDGSSWTGRARLRGQDWTVSVAHRGAQPMDGESVAAYWSRT